jgi:membrane associated rhomboid family serine protease
LLPLSDANPTRKLAILTIGLIVINVIVFLWQLTLSERELSSVFRDLSIVPRNVTRDGLTEETLLDFVRSMFFHGDWLHILSNMLFLWVFGDNVEDRLGKVGFVLLYFISGFAAGFAQVLIDPTSRIPLVGASGAIAGVLGSYIIMFPRARIRTLIFLGVFASFTEISAFWMLGYWFVLQLINGFVSLGVETAGGGVAFFAHIGGFVAGLILTFVFLPLTRRGANSGEDYLSQQYRNG